MRRHGEHGAMLPVMAGVLVLLTVIAMGAATLGRVAAARHEAQRGVDAAALAAANAIRMEGLPFDDKKRLAAEKMAQGNSLHPLAFEWKVDRDRADGVGFTVVAHLSQDVSPLIFPSGEVDVTAKAKGDIAHTIFDETHRIVPKLMLVLDYSGSMGAPLLNSPGQSTISALEDNVKRLLEQELRVDYAAVFFSTRVMRTFGFGPGSAKQILAYMKGQAGGMTSTWLALEAGKKQFDKLPANDESARYLLLVSDGAPHDRGNIDLGIKKSQDAAAALWQSEVTIFTLHLENTSDPHWSKVLSDFMHSVAGPWDGPHPDPDYYFSAASTSELDNLFDAIKGAVACPVKPVDLPEKRFVFLRAPGGVERPLEDLAALKPGATLRDLNSPSQPWRDRDVYFYKADTRTLFLSVKACDAVLDARHKIVVRTERPHLTE